MISLDHDMSQEDAASVAAAICALRGVAKVQEVAVNNTGPGSDFFILSRRDREWEMCLLGLIDQGPEFLAGRKKAQL